MLKLRSACLLMLLLLLSAQGYAQDEDDVNIDNIESLNLDQVQPVQVEPVKGILNKIIQFFKFGENKRLKESKQIRNHIIDLVEKSELKVDTTALNALINQIRIELKNDGVAIDSLTNGVTDNEEQIADSQLQLDALKAQLSAVVQNAIEENSAAKKSLKEAIAADLRSIKDIRTACVSDSVKIEQKELGENNDTLVMYKRCLVPKKKVIGWHNQWNRTEYLDYNYNYLSVLNLYGYELKRDGLPNNLEYLEGFQKPGGVIEKAQAHNTDVHLTIYSKKNSDIRSFLKNPEAIGRFEARVIQLIEANSLKGIVLFFEEVQPADADKFVQFVRNFRQALNEKFGSIELNVVIPAIEDDDSIAKISAYNIAELRGVVNYFIVLTNRLTSYKSTIAKGRSPLYNSDKFGNMSIENTVSYYTNNKIPPKQLIMMISYYGIEWEVNSFNGDVKAGTKGKRIEYRNIVKKYMNTKPDQTVVVGGFDPDQATSYLNITHKASEEENSIENYTQIWYDDNLSLNEKYNWALDNDLGGISIRNLGYDNPYTELWDVLAATMIRVDSTVIQTIVTPPVETFDKWTVFKNDMKWATLGTLKYRDLDSIKVVEVNDVQVSSFVNCKSDENNDHYNYFSKKKIDWLWSEFQQYDDPLERSKDYEEYIISKYGDTKTGVKEEGEYLFTENGDSIAKILIPRYLKDSKTCDCLVGRWEFYTFWLFFTAICSIILLVILKLVHNHLQRLKIGSDKMQFALKLGQIVFLVLALICVMLGVFLAPWIDGIGASNDGNISYDVIFITAFFGILLGWIIRNSIMRGKLVKPNQP